jgi:RHH-type proline utilization regulon transcriptional repressor/proline dehydrogenase/delta 1-pyrroline-5-carboxylate dehydrogenase
LPPELFGSERRNSAGIDLASERQLATLAAALPTGSKISYRAIPLVGAATETGAATGAGIGRPVCNPADRNDVVGVVVESRPSDVDAACAQALAALPQWSATAPAERAAALSRAAELLESTPALLGLIVREAGKSLPNAVAEIREAVDFLRYYGAQVRSSFHNDTHRAVGPVVCISPWNFPLAIFVGQVAAALAAGNPVLAKPAEETPLVAAAAVRLLHEAGIPRGALQFLPGAGEVGAALVADPRICAVMFTGSTAVARLIQRQLAGRLTPSGTPIPLVAETGGQNALIVDSSALPEQVVADVIASAFDSAGQRCSALRILCLQEDIAERVLAMLKGAMRELRVGNPDRLATDVGPVISEEAKENIGTHIETMRKAGHAIEQLALPASAAHGTFVPPTLIEIDSVADVKREVFGPVLHLLRYRRADLEALIDAINDTGYALTFGLHTRIDETIATVSERISAGNIYVNRNVIGAVVGVQPFGGHGLSGTGPKAGGPLYLYRLVAAPGQCVPPLANAPQAEALAQRSAAVAYQEFLEARGFAPIAAHVARYLARSNVGALQELPGPVGERNVYLLKPRGRVAALADSEPALLLQLGAILATGNRAVLEISNPAARTLAALPREIAARIDTVTSWQGAQGISAVLFAGDHDALREVNRRAARPDGPIILVQGASATGLADGSEDYALELLLSEVSISTNTAAAGGNAKLMTIG